MLLGTLTFRSREGLGPRGEDNIKSDLGETGSEFTWIRLQFNGELL